MQIQELRLFVVKNLCGKCILMKTSTKTNIHGIRSEFSIEIKNSKKFNTIYINMFLTLFTKDFAMTKAIFFQR